MVKAWATIWPDGAMMQDCANESTPSSTPPFPTPIHYAPDPSQDILQGFHNALVMQSGAYQNGTWVVGVGKGGVEEGIDS